MRVPLPIETERLTIREFQPEADAEAMLTVYGDPEVMRFVAGGAFRGIETMKARLKTYARESERRGFSSWAVVERETGELIGDAGFGLYEPTGDIELGYTLARAYWGNGFATEAAAACLAAGLEHLAVPRDHRARGRRQPAVAPRRGAAGDDAGRDDRGPLPAARPVRGHQVSNALVTGVSRRAGIGYAIARRLLDAGHGRLHPRLDGARPRPGMGRRAGRNGGGRGRARRAVRGGRLRRSRRARKRRRGCARRARPARHPRRQPRAQRARPARRTDGRAHRRLPPRERARVAPACQGVRGAVHGELRPRHPHDLRAASRADVPRGCLRRVEGRDPAGDDDAGGGARSPWHHRQHRQPRPDRHGLGARQLGSHGGDALRAAGASPTMRRA